MIYVPEKNENKCYVVQSEGVIRAYEYRPYNNANVSYRDYYIDSGYIYRDGQQQFSSYSTIPVCLDNNELTSGYLYRNDIDKIFIVFFIILFICYFILKKIIRVFFHGFRWC